MSGVLNNGSPLAQSFASLIQYASLRGGMEARQFPRVPLDSMAFLRSDRDSAEGALLNLSRTGAQLSAAFRVQPRDSLSLSLSLPFQMPSLEVILAAVRWVKGKNFRVEFIQIAEGEQRQLRDFLTTHPTPNTSS